MKREQDHHDPCAGDTSGGPGCARPPLERLRFWNGRFLVARDLRHQQDDLVRRLEYHQHFAHGEGILCGFGIRRHPRDDCRRDWLVVESGMAYDCCGRTLWMNEPRALRIPRDPSREEPSPDDEYHRGEPPPDEERRYEGKETNPGEWDAPDEELAHEPQEDEKGWQGHPAQEGPEHGAPGHGGPGQGWPHDEEERHHPDPAWFVVACRVECPTDPQPALYADDLCEPVRHEHGRIREEVELRVLPAEQVPEECWPRRRPVSEYDCVHEVDDDCRDERGDTVPCTPGCGCGECVVLVGVWRDPQGRLRWDTTHRKVLTPPTALTRITGVNWPHGGTLSQRRLREKMHGQLVARFSRPLSPAEGFRRGINPMTFEVSFLGQSGTWVQVLPEPGEGGQPTPILSRNGRCAVFTIPLPLLGGRHSLAGSWVRVRLLGDFILDCYGRPVSAAHTGGDVNGRGSGNGVPGGTFESWFYVRHSRRRDAQ